MSESVTRSDRQPTNKEAKKQTNKEANKEAKKQTNKKHCLIIDTICVNKTNGWHIMATDRRQSDARCEIRALS
jgi:hypothetical protein